MSGYTADSAVSSDLTFPPSVREDSVELTGGSNTEREEAEQSSLLCF